MKRFMSTWNSPRRAALFGAFLFFCAGFADGALLPFFPLWAQSAAGIPVGAIGLLFACYAGGELIATPLIGGLADAVGRRPVLIGSSLAVGGAFASLFYAHGILMTAGILLAAGLCESVLHPTALAAISDVTPPETHRFWFSRVRVCSNAGGVLGPIAGAMLALHSLRSVFLGTGGILLLCAVVMLCGFPETRAVASDPVEDDDDDAGFSALAPVLRDRRLAALVLWFALFEISGKWIESVLPLYAHDAGILTPSGVGMLFAYASALTVASQMLVSRLTSGRSASWLTLVAGTVWIAGLALLAAVPSLAAMIVAVSLCTIAQMLTGPLAPAAVHALAPSGRRASYMAASSVAVDLQDSLGPATGTALYAIAARLPWIVGIPLVALASVGLGSALTRCGARHTSPTR